MVRLIVPVILLPNRSDIRISNIRGSLDSKKKKKHHPPSSMRPWNVPRNKVVQPVLSNRDLLCVCFFEHFLPILLCEFTIHLTFLLCDVQNHIYIHHHCFFKESLKSCFVKYKLCVRKS